MKGLIAFLFLCLVGCSSTKVGMDNQPKTYGMSLNEYVLGVGDRISINVWKTPELSVTVPIRPDGRISLPLIGDVEAAGTTSSKLSDSLVKEFGKYVKNAQVSVIVDEPVSGSYLTRVRLTGAVREPKSLPFRQGMTVLDLVLEGGGVTQFSNGNRAKLIHRVGDKVQTFPVYLDDILDKGLLATNYTLSPSDIVIVPERSF